MRDACESWRRKVDCTFVKWACALRDMEGIRRRFPDELSSKQMKQLGTTFTEKSKDVPFRLNNPIVNPAANIYLGIWEPKISEIHALDFLCRFRYGQDLSALFSNYLRLDFKAARQLERLFEEIKDWRAGRRLKVFKQNVEHFLLFEIGYQSGLLDLTPKELVGCFNELCCCRKLHGEEELKKERRRKSGSRQELQQFQNGDSESRQKGHALDLAQRIGFQRANRKLGRKKLTQLLKKWPKARKQDDGWLWMQAIIRLRYDRWKWALHRRRNIEKTNVQSKAG
jgi:hypothetical protein